MKNISKANCVILTIMSLDISFSLSFYYFLFNKFVINHEPRSYNHTYNNNDDVLVGNRDQQRLSEDNTRSIEIGWVGMSSIDCSSLPLNIHFNYALNTMKIIGAVCVSLVAWNFWSVYTRNPELFFLCIAVACLVGTSCLLVSCLISFTTGGVISKTIFELIYHSTAFILYIIASILVLIKANDYRLSSSSPYMLAGVRNFNENFLT